MVLGCFRFGSSRSTNSVSSPSFVRLTLVPAVYPFLVFVFRMFSNLMQCLLSCRFKRLTTVSLASSSAEKRSLYLLKRGDSKRFSSSDGRGTSSSSTVLFRFRSPETLAASRIALVSSF